MRFRLLGLALTVVLIAASALFLTRADRSGSVQASQTVFPKRFDAGYVGSHACTECHPDQHASWKQTYHRTMTQPATVDTVLASFDGVQLETEGYRASLEQRGNEFWVSTTDPQWERVKFAEWSATRNTNAADPFASSDDGPPTIEAQVVMTTGSHHFQVYWIRSPQSAELWQFPWRYHLAEQRWVHRKDVFLTPPEWRPGMWFRVWNHQCSLCHSTGPNPGENQTTGVMENTRIGELGISCEACHGPAEQHVAINRASANVDAVQQTSSIVNPSKLNHRRSGEVCGQCHSHFEHQDPLLTVHGPQFRPGANLHHFGNLIEPPSTPQVMSRFWLDGTNRSGGREFSGMSQSACFQNGEMSCLSCHSMHDSDPNDQLSQFGQRDDACLQCHEALREQTALTKHTHHAVGSTGSECYNCHMPHTNYALFKAIRSHQVDVPRVTPLDSNSRPNACNLCHLDQTLQWSADHLHEWYADDSDSKRVQLSEDEQQIAAGVLWALKGDAGQRVIAAWHLGWQPARTISGSDWMIPLFGELMKDPYAAVRWVAFDALRSDPAYADVQYDFDDDVSEREAIVRQYLDGWSLEQNRDRKSDKKSADRLSRLLLDERGQVDLARWLEILNERDQRMVAGVE